MSKRPAWRRAPAAAKPAAPAPQVAQPDLARRRDKPAATAAAVPKVPLTHAQRKQEMTRLRDHANEWLANNYIDKESLDSIPMSTLKEASELAQLYPDEFRMFPPGAEEALNQREEAELKRREEQIDVMRRGGLGPSVEPVDFDQFLDRRRAHLGEAARDMPAVAPAAGAFAGATRRTPAAAGEGEQEEPPDTRDTSLLGDDGVLSKKQKNRLARKEMPEDRVRNNVIKLVDPDELAVRDHYGLLRPVEPRMDVAILAGQENAGQLLSRPALMDGTTVRHLEEFLMPFYTRKHTCAGASLKKALYHKADVLIEFCEPIMKRVARRFTSSMGVDRLTFVYYVSTPLFVYCIFRRRMDVERTDARVQKHLDKASGEVPEDWRIYSWLGHLYIEGVITQGVPPAAAIEAAAPAQDGFIA